MIDPLDPVRRDVERIGRALREVVQPTSVVCPICGDVVEIPQYNSITRTDALQQHIRSSHFRP